MTRGQENECTTCFVVRQEEFRSRKGRIMNRLSLAKLQKGKYVSHDIGTVCFGSFMMLFCMVLGGLDAWAADPNMWRPEIAVRNDKCIVHEPIQLTISHKNTSAEVRRFTPTKPSSVTVIRDGVSTNTFFLFQTWDEQESDRAVGAIGVPPGDEYVETYWLLLGRSNVREQWTFLFEEAGDYTMYFPDLGGTAVDVTVFAATEESDLAGQAVFSLAAAAVFLGEEQRKDREKGVVDLQTVCSTHASGKHAPYAALALARRLWREEGKATFDLHKYYKYVDVIIEKHPAHHLSDKAYYMRVKGLNKEGKKDRVVECLDALGKRHPKSKYVKRIESEFGVKKRK